MKHSKRVLSALIIVFFSMIQVSHADDPVEIEVNGVEGDASQNVEEALTLPNGIVQDGVVDKLWLERFVDQAGDKVSAALEPYGYYSSKSKITLESSADDEYVIRVDITPGEPVRVSGARIEVLGAGAGEKSLKELVAAFPLRRGSILNQPEYEKTKGALKAKAQELGYLDADFSRHEIRVSGNTTSATIDLALETGPLYHFGEVSISGAPTYPDPFLRRNLAFKPGDIFSYAKIGETQLNFTNTERFREVIVSPDKTNARDDRVPVTIMLKPVSRRTLRLGAGYGTDTGGRFSLTFRDQNLFRHGHEFSANLFVAEHLQGFAAGYAIPSNDNIRSSTSLQLNLQREEVTTYTSRLIALELARNLGLTQNSLLTPYVSFRLEDFVVGTEHSDARLILPGIRYTVDHYDNPARPGRGYRYSLEARGTSRLFGSDTSLFQMLAQGSYIQPLPWRLSLNVRAKTALTPLSDPLRELPPTLRFFAGGDQSVRGYSYQSLGPRDGTGKVVGGKHLMFGSLELERALFDNWGISTFYDAGNAFDSFANLRLAQGVGIGLHYYTPVGAFNLSLARQIGSSRSSYHVHFTVGFEF